jgi:ABC-type transport system substrate-binding protein
VDPVIDRAFTAGSRTLNSAVRQNNYNAIQVEVNKLAYWIPLYFRPTIATDDGRVANFSNNPTSLGPEWNMFAWRLKS